MHELAIARNMLQIAEEELARHGCSQLTLLRVHVGRLSGVVVDSLTFGFECLVKGTPHEGAKIEVVSIPLTLRCGSCGVEFDGSGSRVGSLTPCPQCGEVLGHTVLGGRELSITWIEGN